MSADILVIEYEPRYVEHVRAALAGSRRLEIAPSLDDAVNLCARFEPTVVIITSVLPKLKVEDAITQLRARAGLRATPFLVLMSGYQGNNPRQDAVRYGAQDILQRPFGPDELRARVEQLAATAPNAAATQAIPQDVLEALRRNAELDGGSGSVTSTELFGDILSDVDGGEQQPVKPPQARTPDADRIDQALAEIVESGKQRQPRAPADVSADVEKRLSETLSGLEVKPRGSDSASRLQLDESARAAGATPPPTSPPRRAGDPRPAPPTPRPGAEPPRATPKAAPAKAAAAPQVGTPKQRPAAPPAPKSAADAPPKVAADRQFGHYVLEEQIATGGMAEVFKARMVGMEGFQKTVAIKRILSNLTDSDEFVRMFIDEAKLAAQLSHNNIAQIFDLGKVDRFHYIAMEFIEGRDLRWILAECRRQKRLMPIALALHIASLLASALNYAHNKRDFEDRELGLVHRDVSPQNVLISYHGDVKLCDFGIAKAASKASQTRAGALKGKLQYMSPEQAWGKSIDHRSDIFSLGLVLYEMLTGEKVFAGDSELSVLEQVREPVIKKPSSYNSEVDAEIDRIVLRTLDPDRDTRYQSAAEMQADIEEAMRSAGLAADRAAIADFLAGLTGRPQPGPRAPAPNAPGPAVAQPEDTDTARASVSGTAQAAAKVEQRRKGAPASAGSDLSFDADLEQALAGGGGAAEPPPLTDSDGAPPRKTGDSRRVWILVAIAVVIAAAAAGWYLVAGRSGPGDGPAGGAPVAAVPTATPSPEPVPGLLTEEELIEQARAVAAAEIVKQEEALRDRLEKEFPTATPIPPSPTPTVTATPVPTRTPTRRPPTATPIPPTATPIPPTATPSVREGDIVTLGPGVTAPVVIHQEAPKYPRAAQRMQKSGVVEGEILVGIDGRVEEFQVTAVEGRGLGFEEATENAVRAWRYKPATKNGVPVRMWIRVRIPFELMPR